MKLCEALKLKDENASYRIKRIGVVGEVKTVDLESEKAWDDGWCVVTKSGRHINKLSEVDDFKMSNIMKGTPAPCSSYSEGKCTENPDKYCDGCASEYENSVMEEKFSNRQQLYPLLQIPQAKIELENKRTKIFMGFPFFMRKETDGRVEVITMHDYPIGVYATNMGHGKHLDLSPEIVALYLKKGYEWLHESDIDTTW